MALGWFVCLVVFGSAAVQGRPVDIIPPFWNELVKMLDFNTSHPSQLAPKLNGHCLTDTLWDWKQKFHLKGNGRPHKHQQVDTCAYETGCDAVDQRNHYQGNNFEKFIVDMAITVVCYSETECAGGVNDLRIAAQIEELELDYSQIGIFFRLAHSQYVVNPEYASIRKYSAFPGWYNDISEVKRLYAYKPETNINIFVTDQQKGNQGTLLGIGTFPWDPEYLTDQGGLWMNAAYFGAGGKTLAHEFGHNVGLWHTFHGISEVNCGTACYEPPHPADDPTSDENGDFCSDTLATPLNYYCSNPTGSDTCSADPWTEYGTNYDNIMSYSPDNCMSKFTTNQQGRARCHLCEVVPGVLDSSQNYEVMCQRHE